MYFGEDGRLLAEMPEEAGNGASDRLACDPRVGASTGMHGGGPFNINWAMPLDQREDEVHCLSYTTDPLEEDLEVTGLPRAILHFASTAKITLFAVKLCDVAPDGTSALVTKGYLNVTHRESHSSPSYIEPNRDYQVEVGLLACAYRFLKGHRIRIDIASADFLNVWPTPEPCTNTIYRTARMPSHVILPIVPPQDPALPEPRLKPSLEPMPQRQDLEAPEYTISRDVIQDTVTVQYEASYGPRWINTASFTVSSKEPACAVVRATATCGQHHSGRDIVADAHCVTCSDKHAFHHTVEVGITINGKQHFNKSWSVSVPRRFV